MNSFKRENEVIYITHWPNKKKPVLAIGNGCVIQRVGMFDSEESAEKMCEILNRWLCLDNEVTSENIR